jgi:hypothetical protein
VEADIVEDNYDEFVEAQDSMAENSEYRKIEEEIKMM